MENKQRAQWGGKIGFVLAAAGSAVGLGNIWKFPGKAYEGGGGAYLLIYLAMVLLIGIPVMVTELGLGRFTNQNTVGTFKTLNKKFTWIGWFGVLCGFVIVSYYFHIGGWVCSYILSYITESKTVMADGLAYFYKFLGLDAATGATFFPTRAILFGAIFTIANSVILLAGVSGGIEKFNKVGMPALFVILVILLVRVATLPGSFEGIKYMIIPDWSKVRAETFLSALGQAFYSLSLGMAIMITYGSYLKKDINIAKNSFVICGLDTFVAFMSGFIIVPAVFATVGSTGIGKGGTFAFAALPGVFAQMPAGPVFAVLFYLLLLFAALSSAISIEEGVVAFVSEEWGWERKKAVIIISTVAFLIGVVYTISQAAYTIQLPWFDFTGMHMFSAGDWLEMFTDRVLLPVAALGECIFVGWLWGPKKVIAEVRQNGVKFTWAGIYSFLIKFVCPVAIAVILLYSLITGTTIS